jgi:Tetratricopeptide repeat
LARSYGTRTLARRRSLHGDDHPSTLKAARDLADILSEMGDHEAARELDADTPRRRRRVLGKDHPDTRRSAENLARDLRALRETGWRGWRAGLRRRVTAWWRAWRGRHRAG